MYWRLVASVVVSATRPPSAKPHIARPETRRLARVLAGGTGLAVDAVRVDLEQEGDAMPGAAAAVEDAVAKAPGQSSARR